MTLKCVWCVVLGSMLAALAQGCAHARSHRLPACGSAKDLRNQYRQHFLMKLYDKTRDLRFLDRAVKINTQCRENTSDI